MELAVLCPDPGLLLASNGGVWEMKEFLLVVAVTVILMVGAAAHEADLARNLNETGDAKAWFSDIRCDCGEAKR